MADKNTLEQMLEHLVNDETEKAEELFHEYVVAKSREIYEGLIETEMKDDEEQEDDNKEDEVEENFDELAVEADDEMNLDSDDETDDLEADIDDEMDDEEGDKDPEELFQDLDAIVDELQAKFDAMKGDEDMGDEEEMKDDIELETVREYVEKVPAGHGAEKKGQAEKADGSAGGMKFSKNDMGGQAMKFGDEDGSDKGTAGGLANNKAQDLKSGNINVPGGKAGGAFSTKEPGHGAEKKGAAENADKGAGSLFRGRR
jgi:hypothetical protein